MNNIFNKESNYAIDLWDEEQVAEIFIFEPNDFNESNSIVETITSALTRHTIETYLGGDWLANNNNPYRITLNNITDKDEKEIASSANRDEHWQNLEQTIANRFDEIIEQERDRLSMQNNK